MSRDKIVLAHCENRTCPSRDVPADDGSPGRDRGMHTYQSHWTAVAAGAASPRCGFCGGSLTRSDGDDRNGQNTACARNTWKTYTIKAGTACHIRKLLSDDPSAADARWSRWTAYTTKHEQVFTERIRARPSYWTFRIQSGGMTCEVEFPQWEIQVAR